MILHKSAIMRVVMMNRLPPQDKIHNHYCTYSPHRKIVDNIKVQLCVMTWRTISPRRRFVIIIAPVIFPPPRNIVLHNSPVVCDDLMNRLHHQEKILNHYCNYVWWWYDQNSSQFSCQCDTNISVCVYSSII